ncbi:uncharacterized conserved protein UCP016719 [Thermoanaerobacterium thermosaccharolyticum]|jgi:Protein of unknown function (DUF1343).|uniref:Uncharacterized conserved protein UCP016719 n=1 Tax=Thermoanaerobacterium thermosaccharolyticum TaxID=1517 RepID=A0A223HWZ2_THETR|nr:uncharacterized conserved protein UCP016719 [Thermoanaerobacterium thermosaccharolyticum]
MNEMGLNGVIFRPVYFVPSFSKHSGLCGGVQIHVKNKRTLNSVEIGVKLLYEVIKIR